MNIPDFLVELIIRYNVAIMPTPTLPEAGVSPAIDQMLEYRSIEFSPSCKNRACNRCFETP